MLICWSAIPLLALLLAAVCLPGCLVHVAIGPLRSTEDNPAESVTLRPRPQDPGSEPDEADQSGADKTLPQTPLAEIPPDRYPVDLPTVLRLAGARNWGVRLAAERVREARARHDAAKVLWLPSLNAGVGYTKHEGQIQDTQGEVIDVSRNSLFVGGGAGTGNAATTGGSGGPARLSVDLSLADAVFEPLAAKQLVHAERAREAVTFNDTLLEASLAYYDLFGAQGQLAIARRNVEDAERLLKLTAAFVAAGKGSLADTARARVEVSTRQQQQVDAELAVTVASAELARILQLDPDKLSPETLLFVLEDKPIPVELVYESTPLSALVTLGQRSRPEVAEHQARLEAGRQRVRAERWRPFIPNVHLGTSAGGFGGGVNDDLHQLDGRGDFDLLAVWQLKNLGFGARAARQERSSQFRQALFENYRIRDLIAADVSKAYHQVDAQRRQMTLTEANLKQALDSYDRNLARIRGLEGLPLEAQQALQSVTEARRAHLAAIIGFNQSQLRLLRAIGQKMVE